MDLHLFARSLYKSKFVVNFVNLEKLRVLSLVVRGNFALFFSFSFSFIYYDFNNITVKSFVDIFTIDKNVVFQIVNDNISLPTGSHVQSSDKIVFGYNDFIFSSVGFLNEVLFFKLS